MSTIELKGYRDEPSTDDSRMMRSFVALQLREARLRERLIEARDAMIREQLGWRPPAAQQGTGPAGGPPSRRGGAASEYARTRRSLGAVVKEVVPGGARVLFVSRGDDELLALAGEGEGWHFPGDPGKGYAGHHPHDSAAAIKQLDGLRRQGADFLVFPASETWWLEHYDGLARHLERYERVADDPAAGVVFDLRSARDRDSRERDGVRRPRAGGSDRRPLAAVTIIARNYLPQARVLAKSFHQHEPGGRFYLLVVDRLPDDTDVGVDVEVIDPDELEIPGFYEMCFKYGIVELNTAVKPFLLSLLLDQYDEEEVVYFDPDIMIMRPLDELRDALDDGGIVLTPHIMKPVPMDGERPSEQDIMISGVYNLGFIALRRCAEVDDFLRWWQERLEDGCRIDVERGLFTDQKWIDLVPSLFPSTEILRDPTYNVAFWNLHERDISRRDDEFLVNGRPSAFFHISGFDPTDPSRLSKHQTRTQVAPGSALAGLLELYADALMESGYEDCSGWSYGYECFADGTRVHPLLRQIYLKLTPEERQRFDDPFSTIGPGSFLEWATRPRAEGTELSRFLESLYRTRYDLPLTFPDVNGRDRQGFLRWARRWGSAEMSFDPALVRGEVPTDDGTDHAVAASTGGGADDEAGRPDESSASGGNGAGPAGHSPGSNGRRHDVLQVSKDGYEAMVQRIHDIARATLPAGSRVLVVSKGDYRLVDLGGSEGWHFPQTDSGIYGGYHPPDSRVAIAHLEALRDQGAGYLLIPHTALWWLEYYEGFRRHLEGRYRVVVRAQDSCFIYALREATNGKGPRLHGPLTRWWKRVSGSVSGSIGGA